MGFRPLSYHNGDVARRELIAKERGKFFELMCSECCFISYKVALWTFGQLVENAGLV